MVSLTTLEFDLFATAARNNDARRLVPIQCILIGDTQSGKTHFLSKLAHDDAIIKEKEDSETLSSVGSDDDDDNRCIMEEEIPFSITCNTVPVWLTFSEFSAGARHFHNLHSNSNLVACYVIDLTTTDAIFKRELAIYKSSKRRFQNNGVASMLILSKTDKLVFPYITMLDGAIVHSTRELKACIEGALPSNVDGMCRVFFAEEFSHVDFAKVVYSLFMLQRIHSAIASAGLHV